MTTVETGKGMLNTIRHRGTGLVKSEFIYASAPFPSCHASTIAETAEGLIAAWFGGEYESHSSVGIWAARYVEGHWSEPVEVATGLQADGTRFPCWNPVLFQPSSGPLLLFYKVGPNVRSWWGMLRTSRDGGKVWSEPQALPEGVLGPIKNKPVTLPNGSLLCPSSTEEAGWRVHLERTTDGGVTWECIGPLNDGQTFGAIQPSILRYPAGGMQLLCRSQQECLTECWSGDEGKTWSAMAATLLPNPNSGTDAVMLRDGRTLLVYNHSRSERSPLNVALTSDGRTWQAALVLEDEPGEYSYPAVIETADGLVHITYTWQRQRIKHVVLDPQQMTLQPMRLQWP